MKDFIIIVLIISLVGWFIVGFYEGYVKWHETLKRECKKYGADYFFVTQYYGADFCTDNKGHIYYIKY